MVKKLGYKWQISFSFFFFIYLLKCHKKTVANHFNFLSSLYFYKKLNDWQLQRAFNVEVMV